MKYSGKVLIEKITNKESVKTVANPHHRDNVNVAMGPRVGNATAHDGKRSKFSAQKEERAPLATMIERAFGTRGQDNAEEIKPGLEPIKANSKQKFKTSKK